LLACVIDHGEDLMKIPGKKFALVAAPLVVAASMLGVPLAGSAHAVDRQGICNSLRDSLSYYSEQTGLDDYDENQALEAGAWTDYLYYCFLEARDDALYNYVLGEFNNRGC
jgi:hypothetical protein